LKLLFFAFSTANGSQRCARFMAGIGDELPDGGIAGVTRGMVAPETSKP
jgi:hypothetical protein